MDYPYNNIQGDQLTVQKLFQKSLLFAPPLTKFVNKKSTYP